ncbi:hypothetical protein AVEN_69997-1 [Araneus ventricosus]|uniref:Transmembrane protein 211 n=1 Tax=Araneus ventricosus TaxID=182803 RepID=A0A4Y2KNC9_ARAVE|nr:hypothetical protein AVEN_69997-1 [Araneus ventricosus]
MLEELSEKPLSPAKYITDHLESAIVCKEKCSKRSNSQNLPPSSGMILQAASLMLYPLVLGSPIAKIHCGSQADVYEPAGCRIGWAYIAAITSTVLACYCPLLGHFSHYNVFSPGLWTEI